MTAAAALLLAATTVAAPQDQDYRAALDLLYDGRAEAARERLAALESENPGDPVPAYLQSLVLVWLVEQRPESRALDRRLEQAAARAWAQADGRLRRDPTDIRARFARGAVSGVRSRYHLFRLQRSEAGRHAVRMREDLLAVRAGDPADPDVRFGLGLYDYYVDVLPRFARLLRFLARLPSGDRARGLAAIEEASRSPGLHAVEAQVQLYEIHAFYEDDPERAAVVLEDLVERYPGWPLWTLKLAEHLRDRLGAYAESGAVARRLLHARSGRPDPGPAARALARLSLGASLLLDLEPQEARRVLLPLKDGLPSLPTLGAQARLLLGRSLELEGDHDGAAAHYRVAAASADREWRKRAQEALSRPLSAAEASGRQLLGSARRAREAGRLEEAAAWAREALEAWPASREAALGVAEDDLRHGAPRVRAPEIDERRGDEPPWLQAWSRLLRAQLADREGDRELAVRLYKEVYEQPYRRPDLRQAAAAGIKAPYRAEPPRATRSPPARRTRTWVPTAPGAGFLAVPCFSTAPSTG